MSGSEYSERSACRITGDALDETLIRFDALPVAGAYVDPDDPSRGPCLPFTLMRSSRSGLIQLRESLDPDFYNRYHFVGGVSAGYERQLNRMADHLASAVPKNGRAVEIGCGDGAFLAALKRCGLDTFGFEPARIPAKIAMEKRLTVVNDRLTPGTAVRALGKPVDVVILRHVLEHIDDFSTVFEGINRIAHADTLLLVEVPDTAATVKRKLYGNFYHPHPCYFDIRTLSFLLLRYGWNAGPGNVIEIFGGSVAVLAARVSGRTLFADEPKPAPLDEENLRVFLSSWSAFSKEVHIFFEKQVQSGMTVAGFGAAERTMALIGFCGLGVRHLTALYDNNTEIQGLLSPGSRIEIRAPGRIVADRPGAMAIFAQSHEAEIRQQLRDYVRKGGRIITLNTTPPSFVE